MLDVYFYLFCSLCCTSHLAYLSCSRYCRPRRLMSRDRVACLFVHHERQRRWRPFRRRPYLFMGVCESASFTSLDLILYTIPPAFLYQYGKPTSLDLWSTMRLTSVCCRSDKPDPRELLNELQRLTTPLVRQRPLICSTRKQYSRRMARSLYHIHDLHTWMTLNLLLHLSMTRPCGRAGILTSLGEATGPRRTATGCTWGVRRGS